MATRNTSKLQVMASRACACRAATIVPEAGGRGDSRKGQGLLLFSTVGELVCGPGRHSVLANMSEGLL